MSDKREKLAEYSHNAWSGWMKYMFSKGEFKLESIKINTDGTHDDKVVWIMPSEYVDRWIRQMETEYKKLPGLERTSDLEEADKILLIINSSDE